MKAKLLEWASVAEIVSGIAVVITLVFLVLSIREETAVTRAAVYSDLLEEINRLDEVVIADPELSRLIDAFADQDTAGLDEAERRRLQKMVLALFRIYDKAYFANEAGLVGDPEWERMQSATCIGYARATAFGMELDRSEMLAQEFRNHMAEAC
jgi:hypothetical protein